MGKQSAAQKQGFTEGLEAIRMRPGMYVGNVTDGSALAFLLDQVLGSSVGEHARGFGDRITVELREDGTIIVSDEGRGMPLDVVGEDGETWLEREISSLSHERRSLGYGAEPRLPGEPPIHNRSTMVLGSVMRPVGCVAANALSEEFSVEVRRQGKLWRQGYRQGKPQGPLAAVGAAEGTGTTIRFKPDETLFRTITRLDFHVVARRLRHIALLCPGLTLELRQADKTITIRAPRGLLDGVGWLCQGEPTVLDPPLHFVAEGRVTTPTDEARGWAGLAAREKTVWCDVAVQWLAAPPHLALSMNRGFTNGILNIDGGAHIAGVRAGLLQGARDVLLRQGRINPWRWPSIAAAILARTALLVSVVHPRPLLSGRLQLENEDVILLLKRETRRRVVELLTRQPGLIAHLATDEKATWRKKPATEAQTIPRSPPSPQPSL